MKKNKGNFKVIAISIAVVAVLLLLGILPPGISLFTSVPSGTTGIITNYGKVEETHLDAGIHFKAPWKRIVVMDNRVQTLVVAAGTKDATTTDTAETADQQLIPTYRFEIQYQLNPEMSYIVYENYGEEYYDKLITPNALQIIKNTFSKINAEDLVKEKANIPETVKTELAAMVEEHGINIIRVNMTTYDFTPEYSAILEERAYLVAQIENNKLEQQNQTIAAQTEYDVAVKNAERDAETERIKSESENAIAVAKAETNAEVEKINAEAERDARMAKAEATKAELEAESAGLNELVIQKIIAEKWDGKLMPNFGSGTVGFANMTDLIESYTLYDNPLEGTGGWIE